MNFELQIGREDDASSGPVTCGGERLAATTPNAAENGEESMGGRGALAVAERNWRQVQRGATARGDQAVLISRPPYFPNPPHISSNPNTTRERTLEPPSSRRRERGAWPGKKRRAEKKKMGGLEQEQGLSLGVLIDIVDEQWMRDTLPAEDIPVPPAMAVKTEDAEDPAPANQESHPAQGEVWRDFALENL